MSVLQVHATDTVAVCLRRPDGPALQTELKPGARIDLD